MFPMFHGIVDPIDLGFNAIKTEYELEDFKPDLHWKVEKCDAALRPGIEFAF